LNPEALDKLRSLATDIGIPIRVSGSCMSPLLKNQASILIRSHSWYWPGDILTFLDRNGRLTTHRLLGMFPRNGKLYCLTRPDRHLHPDAAVPSSHILGKVVGGECHAEAIHIPWTVRWLCLKRFALHILRHLLRQ